MANAYTAVLDGPGAPAITVDEMVSGGSFKCYGDPNDANIPARIGQTCIDRNTGEEWVKLTDDSAATGWVRTSQSGGVISTGTTELRTNANRFGELGNLKDFDGDLVAALAAWDRIRIEGESFPVASSMTIAAGKVLIFENGGKLKPASGQLITINGEVIAPRVEIFDYTASGRVALGFFSRTDHIYPEWYGAKADNSTINDTAFARIFDQTYTAENRQPVLLGMGYYNLTTGFTVFSRCIIRGPGKLKCRLNFAPTVTGRLITLPDGVDHFILSGVQLNAHNVPALVRTTAIGHATAGFDVSNFELDGVSISSFNQFGVDLYEVQYAKIIDTEFSAVSNTTGVGGSGDTSAICLNFRTFANAVFISGMTKASNCEAFLKTVRSTSLSIENGSFEQATGSGLDAITNKTHFIDVAGGNIRIAHNYFEGIITESLNAVINVASAKAWSVKNNQLNGIRAGGSVSVTTVFVKQGTDTYAGTVSENDFFGTPTWYILADTTAGFISALQNTFTNDAGTQLTTYTGIKALLTAQVTAFTISGEYNHCRAHTFRLFTNTTAVVYPAVFTKERTGAVGATNDGVGIQFKAMVSDGSIQPAGEVHWIWAQGGAGSEISNINFKALAAGAIVTPFSIEGSGGVTVRGSVRYAYRESGINVSLTQVDHMMTLTASGLTATLPNSTNLPLQTEFHVALNVGGAATGTVAFVNATDRVQPANTATYALSADGKYVRLRLVKANVWLIVANN